jgi:transcriptional regulator with XRE-family HTH domain
MPTWHSSTATVPPQVMQVCPAMSQRSGDKRESSGKPAGSAPAQTRLVDWWNRGAGLKLKELLEEKSKRVEKLAKEIEVKDSKTIRNWIRADHRPTNENLGVLCQALGVTMEVFRLAAKTLVAESTRPTTSHPHAALLSLLEREALADSTANLEFLAPPGYLKTEALKDLERRLRSTHKCVYARAPDAANFASFWATVADKFQHRHVRLSAHFTDRYDAISEGVEGLRCVLLVDGADRWIFQQRYGFDDARTWLSRLVGLPCLVIVAGTVSLNDVIPLSGGPESGDQVRTLEVPLNDAWETWSACLRDDRGITSAAHARKVEKWSMGHPGVYLRAVDSLRQDDVEHVRKVVGAQHHAVGRLILDRLPVRLRQLLERDGGTSLVPTSRDARALLKGRILLEDRGRVGPAIAAWQAAWTDQGVQSV